MAEDIQDKLQKYRTAPFDARFPNQNQTRNCWSNYVGKIASCIYSKNRYTDLLGCENITCQDYVSAYLIDLNKWVLLIDYYRCQKALDAKGIDTAPCEWYKRVYKSLCPMSWVNIPHNSQRFYKS